MDGSWRQLTSEAESHSRRARRSRQDTSQHGAVFSAQQMGPSSAGVSVFSPWSSSEALTDGSIVEQHPS